MYASIVLAFDGSRTGRVALRQGAELATLCGAKTHLVAVMPDVPGIAMVEGVYPVEALEQDEAEVREVIQEGLDRLRKRGLSAEGHLGVGDPADQISRIAREVEADLVVVGHRHHGPLARWWRGSLGRSLLDLLDCSVLVAMNGQGGAEE
ncbi:MAG: universal stress protein [Ectothiorhodospiraceae bacterium]|jgi:nucleotide-binding universal stress UspA family protein